MPSQVSILLSVDLSKLLTCSEDLWAALGEASGKPVADVMSTWTQQLGYPVLTVDAKQVISVVLF